MEKIKISTEYIKLDALLKFSGFAATGGEAKLLIEDGRVSLNGEQCSMRGKKVRPGDIVKIESRAVQVEAENVH